MLSRQLYRSLFAVIVSTAVLSAATVVAMKLPTPRGSFLPASFITHSMMLVLSVVAILLISKRRLDLYGFTRGTFRFRPQILLWALPSAMLATAQALASPRGQAPHMLFPLTKIQTVLFVWIYASICEETLVRGLFQTMLRGASAADTDTRVGLSYRVTMSGLFFGAMHLVLIRMIGIAAIPIAVMTGFLGCVLAWYRERTGSLLPSILIHALFNIGGAVPIWLVVWLRG
jgi:membrane protease YdiL (CAAX protease family)